MKTSWDDKYKVYKHNYLEKQTKLINRGQVMNEKMLSKMGFIQRYEETKSVLQEDIASGHRKALGNIYQEMISDQAYAVDYKTYNAIRRHNKEIGDKSYFTREMTYSQIKETLSEEFWDTISDDYYELSKLYGKKAASALISQLYFGSE